VFSGAFSLPGGLKEGDWIEIPLSTPFTYDAGKNLVIQLSSDHGSSAHGCRVEGSSTRYPARAAANFDRTQPTGGVSDYLADLRLWINK
jgi:hypothetical protein